MRFVTIEPAAHLITYLDCPTLEHALQIAGLTGFVDHGKVDHAIAIVIDEFRIFDDPEHQDYFALGGRLYAGNAVLYSYDLAGAAMDMPEVRLEPIFLHGRAEVDAAINAGIVARPVNDELNWRWPEPAPFSEQGHAS